MSGRPFDAALYCGLVDEASVLVSQCLVGSMQAGSILRASNIGSAVGVIRLRVIHVEELRQDAVWPNHKVMR